MRTLRALSRVIEDNPRLVDSALQAPIDAGGLAVLASAAAALPAVEELDPAARLLAEGAQYKTELLAKAGGSIGVGEVAELLGISRPALDIHRAGDGCYVNPAAPLLMRPILDDLLAPVLVSEDNPQKVTILTADWQTSVGLWFFDKRAMKAAVREIMGRRHGVFSIEFADYRNQRDTRTPYRPIVAFHVEGVAWGTETERQKRAANKVLPPGLFSAPSVVRKDIYDRRGAVDCCIKHPYRVYSVYWFADGTRNHQASSLSCRLMYEIWKSSAMFGGRR